MLPSPARRLITCLLALAVLGSGTSAYSGSDVLERALADFRDAHGSLWELDAARDGRRAEFVWGGRLAPPEPATNNAQLVDCAYFFAALTQPLHGLDTAYLVPDRVTRLPLSLIGSTDKVAVRLRQEKDGVTIERGWITMLMTPTGSMLAMESTGTSGLRPVNTSPTVGDATAMAVATEEYRRETGFDPTEISDPELIILPIWDSATSEHRLHLVWSITLITDPALVGYTYKIDAREGLVLQRDDAVHHLDVNGTVKTEVTEGQYPHGNPNSPGRDTHPLVDAAVYWTKGSQNGLTYTDEDGDFTIEGIDMAGEDIFVTVGYEGHWCDVDDLTDGSDDWTDTQVLAAQDVVLQPPGQLEVAQANAYYWWNEARRRIKLANSADSVPDIARASVRVNDGQGSACCPIIPMCCSEVVDCRATYNSGGIPFLAFDRQGLFCFNMSFASTVVHEMGHWLNDRYGLGNPPSGMGEAVADTLAMFVTGSPSISPGHKRNNQNDILRSGENSRRYCGNKNTDCYQHAGGSLVDDSWSLAGAFWKMRNRLVASQGQQQGDLVAMVILNAWQNFFTTTEIKDNIVIRLLNLIDDDNDIRNGTPYYADITRGFADQGWPDKRLSCSISGRNRVLRMLG